MHRVEALGGVCVEPPELDTVGRHGKRQVAAVLPAAGGGTGELVHQATGGLSKHQINYVG